MHPFQEHKQHKVERSRVGQITRGYATGGAVAPAPERKRGGGVNAMRDAQAVQGGSAKERQDRPGRARGGRTNKSKGTNVNVIVAPSGNHPMPVPMPTAGVGAPGPVPGPAPMGPRPMPAPGPMAGAPGPMPIRASGGRAYAKGGAVFAEGRRNGTQVQNNPSGKNDQKDVGRGRVITYKTGGAVSSSATGQHGPKFKGGAGGGEARLQKEKRAAKTYKRA
jgi:hypothetical protein